MRTYLAIEGLSSDTLMVTGFEIQKTFQAFFSCRFTFKWFIHDPRKASVLPEKSFSLKWDDGCRQVDLFMGRIEQVSMRVGDDHLFMTATGGSHLRRELGEAPALRAYQMKDQRVQDVLNQVAGFNWVTWGDTFQKMLAQPCPLALQYNLSAFDFVGALLAQHGAPLLPDDAQKQFVVGFQRHSEERVLTYRPHEDPFFQIVAQHFRASLPDVDQTEPHSYPDWNQDSRSGVFQELRPTISSLRQSARSSTLVFQTIDQHFYPGDVIHCEDAVAFGSVSTPLPGLRIQGVTCTWSYPEDVLHVQATCLANHATAFAPPRPPPVLFPRLLGTVVKTNGDPENLGRIQVQLFGATEFAQQHRPACWVPVLTPYQGAFEGFAFLPERSDQVILECLDACQSLWAVTGSLRTRANPLATRHPEYVKVLQTSRGNRITFDARPSAAKAAREKITIQNGVNTLEFSSSKNAGQFVLRQNNIPVIRVDLKGRKKQTVEISSIGDLVLRAQGSITLQARKNLDLQAVKKGRIKSGKKLSLKGDEIHLN